MKTNTLLTHRKSLHYLVAFLLPLFASCSLMGSKEDRKKATEAIDAYNEALEPVKKSDKDLKPNIEELQKSLKKMKDDAGKNKKFLKKDVDDLEKVINELHDKFKGYVDKNKLKQDELDKLKGKGKSLIEGLRKLSV